MAELCQTDSGLRIGKVFDAVVLAAACFGLICRSHHSAAGFLYTESGELVLAAVRVDFLCTLIAAYSRTPMRAGFSVFLFAAGMLAAYYLTAWRTGSVYSMTFVFGWALFSFLTPVFAFFAWYGKGKGGLPV